MGPGFPAFVCKATGLKGWEVRVELRRPVSCQPRCLCLGDIREKTHGDKHSKLASSSQDLLGCFAGQLNLDWAGAHRHAHFQSPKFFLLLFFISFSHKTQIFSACGEPGSSDLVPTHIIRQVTPFLALNYPLVK